VKAANCPHRKHFALFYLPHGILLKIDGNRIKRESSGPSENVVREYDSMGEWSRRFRRARGQFGRELER